MVVEVDADGACYLVEGAETASGVRLDEADGMLVNREK